jgi:1-acyl-sn-glycerol-3-phosphate acyltransferase
LVRVWRLGRLVLHLIWGVLLAAVWLPQLHGESRRGLVRRWSAHIPHILGINILPLGAPPGSSQPLMLVANHISWLDIWVINATYPVRFVSKAEVLDWPVIGWLAVRVGVIFLERSRRSDTHRVSNLASQALAEGDALCMFPEGTTTDGTHVLPFRTSLLQAPIDAGVNVQPVAIRYVGAGGGVNAAVAYHGDITMWQSLCGVLAQRRIVAELHFLPVVATQGLDRRELAHCCREAINDQLHPAAQAAPEIHGDPPA